jgi:DNA-binding CsgD family transcriptional regulator
MCVAEPVTKEAMSPLTTIFLGWMEGEAPPRPLGRDAVNMSERMTEGYQTLTEKEKQTLRLVVRGYDAKSMARYLGLSIHTVNERLRYARRKMEVSSSREAARILLDKEGGGPKPLGDKQLGEAGTGPAVKHHDAPDDGRKAGHLLAWAIGGMVIMSLVLATLLLSSPTHVATSANLSPQDAASDASAAESDVVQAARQWLVLVDEGRWSDSWNATGQSFKQLNTSDKWASVSEEVRPPLGRVISRTANGQESVPAPPYGYQMVRFRTNFANRPDASETLTLAREGGSWKVVGYRIG